MKVDFLCPQCSSPVRRCHTRSGTLVLVEPRPVKRGLVWIDGYDKGRPRIEIAKSYEDVPRNEPLTYAIHSCKEVTE